MVPCGEPFAKMRVPYQDVQKLTDDAADVVIEVNINTLSTCICNSIKMYNTYLIYTINYNIIQTMSTVINIILNHRKSVKFLVQRKNV